MHNFNFFAEKPFSSYRKSDTALIVLVFLLWGIGMVTLYFCSSGYAQRVWGNPFHFVQRQLISSLIGFAFMMFFACFNLENFRRVLPVLVLGTLVVCVLVFIPGLGLESKGARRWLKIPYFSTFQPSEAVKFSMVLYLANQFDKQEKLSDEEKSVLPAFLGLVVFTGIIFAQQDFSTGMFVFVIGLMLFFVTGAKLSWFIPFAGLGFFKYNGMPLEEFIKAFLVSEILTPRELKFESENIYYEAIKPYLDNKENYIQFFIRAIGNGLICYEANINSIIGKYIEDYIRRENLNNEFKYKFFRGEKPIDNLNQTIKELEIENLDVISTK